MLPRLVKLYSPSTGCHGPPTRDPILLVPAPIEGDACILRLMRQLVSRMEQKGAKRICCVICSRNCPNSSSSPTWQTFFTGCGYAVYGFQLLSHFSCMFCLPPEWLQAKRKKNASDYPIHIRRDRPGRWNHSLS